MKRILLIICSILLFTTIYAQEKRIVYRHTDYKLQNGDYEKDPGLDKYMGTWEWKSGNDSFTIILKKKEKVKYGASDFIYYIDMAAGWYKYVKNGVVVENSLDKQNAIITDLKSVVENTTIGGYTQQDNYLGLLVAITGEKFLEDVRLESIPGKPDELQWTVYYKNTINKAKQEHVKIPVNMVLKKVKTANGGISGGLGSIIVQ